MSKSGPKRPSKRRIGARVRIKPDFQNEVEALFAATKIIPIYKDLRDDGNVSYWFGKEQEAELAGSGVLERIPLHHWAHYAIIGEPSDEPSADKAAADALAACEKAASINL